MTSFSRPARTSHYTRHSVGPAHYVFVHRAGGADGWVVSENDRGHVVFLTDLAEPISDRDEADVIAAAYAATNAPTVKNGATP